MSYVFAIGGGKGGVGKSFITSNLGVLLAKQGHRVVLFDLDLGGANLHTFLGLRDPKVGLNDFLNKSFKNLMHSVLPTDVPNLSIICSTNCSMEVANLLHAQKLKIINAIKKLPYDYILLDLGGGTNLNTLDFFLASNEGIFIFTPEPTSVENTFHFIKAIYYRKVKLILKQQTFNAIVKEYVAKYQAKSINLQELIQFITERDPTRGKFLQSELGALRFKLIMNEFRKQINPTFGDKIEKVCNKHFYSKFQFLGNVFYDERVHDSVLSRKLFIKKYPYALAATDLQQVSTRLIENAGDPILGVEQK